MFIISIFSVKPIDDKIELRSNKYNTIITAYGADVIIRDFKSLYLKTKINIGTNPTKGKELSLDNNAKMNTKSESPSFNILEVFKYCNKYFSDKITKRKDSNSSLDFKFATTSVCIGWAAKSKVIK